MKLLELLNGLEYSAVNISNIEINGIASHSKNVNPGELFIFLPGYMMPSGERRTDTHIFVEDVINSGASAIVAEKELKIETQIPIIYVKDSWYALSKIASNYYMNPSEQLNIIGVTGTNGKTSITYILEKIFKSCNIELGIIGTIGNKIGDLSEETNNTTPEAPILHRLLSYAHKNKVQWLAIEATSHALALKRMEHIRFKFGIFTNLTQDHLDFHGNMNDYFLAKRKLFENIEKNHGVAILNKDDKYYDQLAGVCTNSLSYAVDNYVEADVYAKDIKFTQFGSNFNLWINSKEYNIDFPMVGKCYVYNALAAITLCSSMQIDISHIIDGLKNVSVPGRFELINLGQPFYVIIDFAHSPDAMQNVLSISKELNPKKIITVFGCGGNRDKLKRPIMGGIAEQFSDFTILTSDNPRNEEPLSIIEDIKQGIQGEKFCIEIDRKSAIKKAISIAQKNDLVIILGRGHEDYQTINNTKIPLNDKKLAEESLKILGYSKKNASKR